MTKRQLAQLQSRRTYLVDEIARLKKEIEALQQRRHPLTVELQDVEEKLRQAEADA